MSKSSTASVEGGINGSASWFGVEACGPGRLRLHGELDMSAVEVLRAGIIGVEGDLDVDCCELTFIDVAGLRELLAAHRGRQVRGAKLRIVNPSRCVLRLVRLTGFDVLLDGPPASSAR